MKKKMTSWLLPLVLVLLLVPCIAVVVSAEDAADTPVVYVGGKPLTVGKYLAVDNPETESDEGVISDTQPSGGYAYLSEDGKTLTLNDYTYEGLGYYYQQKNAYALIFIKSELTIHLIGENSLVAYSNENSLVTYSNEENNVSHLYGIYTRENRLLNINGEGSLNININNENESGYGIGATSSVNPNDEDFIIRINECTLSLDINANEGFGIGFHSQFSALYVKDSNITINTTTNGMTAGEMDIQSSYIYINSYAENVYPLLAFNYNINPQIVNGKTLNYDKVEETGTNYKLIIDSEGKPISEVYIEPAGIDHKWSTTYSFNEDGHRKYCLAHENCPANKSDILSGYKTHTGESSCTDCDFSEDVLKNASVMVNGFPLVENTAMLNTGYVTYGVPEIAGYAYYKDGTLTLNGFVCEFEGSSNNPIFPASVVFYNALNIELEGVNTLTSDALGIFGYYGQGMDESTPDLTIDGTGELYIKAPIGIFNMGGCNTINGGTVDIQVTTNNKYGVIMAPIIIMDWSQDEELFVLGENVVIEEPEGAVIDSFKIDMDEFNRTIWWSIFTEELEEDVIDDGKKFMSIMSKMATHIRIVTETPAVEESFPIGNVFRSLRNISFHTAGAGDLNLVRAFGSTVNLTKIQPEPREGYIFTGWYADEALTKPITRIVVTGDVTLYAGWEAIAEEEETEETAAAEAEEAAG